ncbi:hypothetical protein [Nocardia xishanensis]
MISPRKDTGAGIGMHAGWALEFHNEDAPGQIKPAAVPSVSSDDHNGEIDVTLPGGLDGGVYTLTVEGLSDDSYRTIAQSVAERRSILRLYLFWYDAPSSFGAFASSLAGGMGRVGNIDDGQPADRMVAELAVVSITRQVGTRHYETVIIARERAFERLNRRLTETISLSSPRDAVQAATDRVGVKVDFHGNVELEASAKYQSALGSAMTTFSRGNTYRDEIIEVARAIEQATSKYGRGVLLIRDGTLHVGVRTGPLGGGNPVYLTPHTGLIEVAAAGTATDTSSTDETSSRRRYTLVLKGRPDLKPGTVVTFDPPATEQAATTPSIGAAIGGPLVEAILPESGPKLLLYVDSVSHRLGRTTGFVTTISGVQVERARSAEDIYDPPPPAGFRAAADTVGATDSAVRAAGAIQRKVRDALATLRLAEAGEVRAAVSSGDGSADVSPRQTVTVWRGLIDGDGHPNRLARLPIHRDDPNVCERVPRVTPFAWGKTGLVVPRYPGTRVLLGHGCGAADDPIDLGALWAFGAGPDAQPGDWWLILPVGVDQAVRSSIGDDDEPEPHTGPVTQDLIDADGNRVIEVGELTIRVTRELADAGTRPERGDSDAVTIEHADVGSRIVMTSDGTVRIEATKIELDAGSEGEIAMTAKNVTVSVTGTMDVS